MANAHDGHIEQAAAALAALSQLMSDEKFRSELETLSRDLCPDSERTEWFEAAKREWNVEFRRRLEPKSRGVTLD